MIDTTNLRGPLGWSLISIVVIGFFCINSITTVVTPLFHLSGDIASDNDIISLVQEHEAHVVIDIARFNGRSAFFKPIHKAPPTPPPTKKDKDAEEEPIYVPPPPPIRYTGPALIAVIGEEAWFRGGGSGFDSVIRLKAGEESDGVKLVSTAAPSIVTVYHRGREYELDMFDSDEPFFRDDPPPSASSAFLEEVD
jgi:hypothetical protein